RRGGAHRRHQAAFPTRFRKDTLNECKKTHQTRYFPLKTNADPHPPLALALAFALALDWVKTRTRTRTRTRRRAADRELLWEKCPDATWGRVVCVFCCVATLMHSINTSAANLPATKQAAPIPVPIPAVSEPFPAGIPAADQTQIEIQLKSLSDKLTSLRSKIDLSSETAKLDLLADADLFHKGIVWALRYETNLATSDSALLLRSLQRGHQRADALLAGRMPWAAKKGKVLRGYISRVDGSTQPYGVIVPSSYDGTTAIRLDVVLHGSMRPVGLSELRFGTRFDEGDDTTESAPVEKFIELHPLGRVENCYRWAGETDVFEAIESICRNYNIDRDRVVLRGMSMGASGTWHLGLKHPDRFVALGPYCGYVDTHQFSQTPLSTFVKVGPLPAHQEKALHMLDSIDYAANAG